MKFRRFPHLSRLFLGILLLWVACVPVLAHGESAEQKRDLTELPLEELMEIEVEEVVSASRYKQKAIEAPSLVTVITAEEIKRYGYQTLADVYRQTLGFYTTYDREYTYTGVRGFGRPGDYDSRILVLIDGMRINEGVYDSPGAGTEFPLDLGLVERIEIVRGPGSSLYGTNALFGIVNVITRKGSSVNAGEIAATVGRFDTYRGRATLGGSIGNDGEFLISGSKMRSHGENSLSFDSGNGGDATATNLDNDRFGQVFSNLRIGELSIEAYYASRGKDSPNAPYDTIINQEPHEYIDRRAGAFATWQHDISEKTKVEARVGYSWYEYEGIFPYESEDSNLPLINEDYVLAERWNYDVKFSTKPFDHSTVVFGFDYRDDFNLDQENFNSAPREFFTYAHGSEAVAGAYLQDETKLTDWVTVSLGGRIDQYDSIGQEISPRAAIVLTPSPTTAVKLLYGRAFRAPNSFELAYGDVYGSFAPNPNLRPESIHTYEVVVEHYLSKDVRFALAGYYNNIENLINQILVGDEETLTFENADKTSATGLDFEIRGRWEDGTLAHLNYSFSETKDHDTGATISNSPRHLIKAGISIPLIPDTLFLSPTYLYVSERTSDRGSAVADYGILNLTTSYETPFKGLSIDFSIYNLFDRTYREPVSSQHRTDQVAQDGRVLRAGLLYRFDIQR